MGADRLFGLRRRRGVIDHGVVGNRDVGRVLAKSQEVRDFPRKFGAEQQGVVDAGGVELALQVGHGLDFVVRAVLVLIAQADNLGPYGADHVARAQGFVFRMGAVER